MLILGIESSCDETAVAIVENGKTLLSQEISSQINDHSRFFGVVPEIASRKHLEVIFDLIDLTLNNAHKKLIEIDAIAVTKEPGLMGSLLVGFSVAKTIAYLLNKPLIPVNHLWAHFYAPFLETDLRPSFPYAGLLISGGHTFLASIRSFKDIQIMGSTIDDAVGECYDKVARMLKLSYPGGPLIDKLSLDGDSHYYKLPTMELNYDNDRYNFSYSGLKTAAKRLIEKEGYDLRVSDFAASFQKSAIDILVKKSLLFCEDHDIKTLIVAGGVACNRYLREKLNKIDNVQIFIPSPLLSTDNAAMVAGLSFHLPSYNKTEYSKFDVNDKILSFKDKKALR